MPPACPALSDGEVHIWRASLAVGATRLAALWATLPPDERARAERLHFERDRASFVAARGLLRAILGRYLGTPADELRFAYGPHGKPSLAWPGAPGLHFNLAHSQGLGLYAVACHREVGIDVEQQRPDLDLAALARQVLSPGELAAWQALPAAARAGAFWRAWTRKEAYVKARGQGLTMPLGDLEALGEPALRIPADPAEAGRWSMCDVAPAPGYAAALAVEGQGWQLLLWQWPQT